MYRSGRDSEPPPASPQPHSQSLRTELTQLEGSAAEQDKLRRQIQDLLAYRRSVAQEESMAQELAGLAQSVGEVGEVRCGIPGGDLQREGQAMPPRRGPTEHPMSTPPRTQGEDWEGLEARVQQLQAELSRLKSKQDQSVGSLRTIQDNVRPGRRVI